MVRRQTEEIPAEFLDGIAEISVSPRAVAHPDRPEIWTLGECIPLSGTESESGSFQSRIVLYHGSFQSLAHATDAFDWEHEAWETLTHEIRHHVEWKAGAPDLEAFDAAAEANFARLDGDPFDPEFYRDGVRRPDGAFAIDDDVFLEQIHATVPETARFRWQSVEYQVAVPDGTTLPAFLTVEGVGQPPAGELVLVLQKKRSLSSLFGRARVSQITVRASRIE